MICRRGQIIGIADDEALRPDKGIESVVGTVGLIALPVLLGQAVMSMSTSLSLRPFRFRIRRAGRTALRGPADVQPLIRKWALPLAVACDSDLCSQLLDWLC